MTQSRRQQCPSRRASVGQPRLGSRARCSSPRARFERLEEAIAARKPRVLLLRGEKSPPTAGEEDRPPYRVLALQVLPVVQSRPCHSPGSGAPPRGLSGPIVPAQSRSSPSRVTRPGPREGRWGFSVFSRCRGHLCVPEGDVGSTRPRAEAESFRERSPSGFAEEPGGGGTCSNPSSRGGGGSALTRRHGRGTGIRQPPPLAPPRWSSPAPCLPPAPGTCAVTRAKEGRRYLLGRVSAAGGLILPGDPRPRRPASAGMPSTEHEPRVCVCMCPDPSSHLARDLRDGGAYNKTGGRGRRIRPPLTLRSNGRRRAALYAPQLAIPKSPFCVCT